MRRLFQFNRPSKQLVLVSSWAEYVAAANSESGNEVAKLKLLEQFLDLCLSTSREPNPINPPLEDNICAIVRYLVTFLNQLITQSTTKYSIFSISIEKSVYDAMFSKLISTISVFCSTPKYMAKLCDETQLLLDLLNIADSNLVAIDMIQLTEILCRFLIKEPNIIEFGSQNGYARIFALAHRLDCDKIRCILYNKVKEILLLYPIDELPNDTASHLPQSSSDSTRLDTKDYDINLTRAPPITARNKATTEPESFAARGFALAINMVGGLFTSWRKPEDITTKIKDTVDDDLQLVMEMMAVPRETLFDEEERVKLAMTQFEMPRSSANLPKLDSRSVSSNSNAPTLDDDATSIMASNVSKDNTNLHTISDPPNVQSKLCELVRQHVLNQGIIVSVVLSMQYSHDKTSLLQLISVIEILLRRCHQAKRDFYQIRGYQSLVQMITVFVAAQSADQGSDKEDVMQAISHQFLSIFMDESFSRIDVRPTHPAYTASCSNIHSMEVISYLIKSKRLNLVHLGGRLMYTLLRINPVNIVLFDCMGVLEALCTTLSKIVLLGPAYFFDFYRLPSPTDFENPLARSPADGNSSTGEQCPPASGPLLIDVNDLQNGTATAKSHILDLSDMPSVHDKYVSIIADLTLVTQYAAITLSCRGSALLHFITHLIVAAVALASPNITEADLTQFQPKVNIMKTFNTNRNDEFSSNLPQCQNCDAESAVLECIHPICTHSKCIRLCRECDRVFHKAVAKRAHIRLPIVECMISEILFSTMKFSTINAEFIGPALMECKQILGSREQKTVSCKGFLFIDSALCILLSGIRGLLDDRRSRQQSIPTTVLEPVIACLRIVVTLSPSYYPTYYNRAISTSKLSTTSNFSNSHNLRQISSNNEDIIKIKRAETDFASMADARHDVDWVGGYEFLISSSESPPENMQASPRRVSISLLIQLLARLVTYTEDGLLASTSGDQWLDSEYSLSTCISTFRRFGGEAVLAHLVTHETTKQSQLEQESNVLLTSVDRQFALWTLRECVVTANRYQEDSAAELLRWLLWIASCPLQPTTSVANSSSSSTPGFNSKSISVDKKSKLSQLSFPGPLQLKNRMFRYATFPLSKPAISIYIRILCLQELRLLLHGDEIISSYHGRSITSFQYMNLPFKSSGKPRQLSTSNLRRVSNNKDGLPPMPYNSSSQNLNRSQTNSESIVSMLKSSPNPLNMSVSFMARVPISSASIKSLFLKAGAIDIALRLSFGDLCNETIRDILPKQSLCDENSRSLDISSMRVLSEVSDTLQLDDWFNSLALLWEFLSDNDEAKSTVEEQLSIKYIIECIFCFTRDAQDSNDSDAIPGVQVSCDTYTANNLLLNMIMELTISHGRCTAPRKGFAACCLQMPMASAQSHSPHMSINYTSSSSSEGRPTPSQIDTVTYKKLVLTQRSRVFQHLVSNVTLFHELNDEADSPGSYLSFLAPVYHLRTRTASQILSTMVPLQLTLRSVCTGRRSLLIQTNNSSLSVDVSQIVNNHSVFKLLSTPSTPTGHDIDSSIHSESTLVSSSTYRKRVASKRLLPSNSLQSLHEASIGTNSIEIWESDSIAPSTNSYQSQSSLLNFAQVIKSTELITSQTPPNKGDVTPQSRSFKKGDSAPLIALAGLDIHPPNKKKILFHLPLLDNLAWTVQSEVARKLHLIIHGILLHKSGLTLSDFIDLGIDDDLEAVTVGDSASIVQPAPDELYVPMSSLNLGDSIPIPKLHVIRHYLSLFATSEGSPCVFKPNTWLPQYSRLRFKSIETAYLLLSIALASRGESQYVILTFFSQLIDSNPINAELLTKTSSKTVQLFSRLMPILPEKLKTTISYLTTQLLCYHVSVESVAALTSLANKQAYTVQNNSGVEEIVDAIAKGDASIFDENDTSTQALFILGKAAKRENPTRFIHFDQTSLLSGSCSLPSISNLPTSSVGYSLISWLRLGNLGNKFTASFSQLSTMSESKAQVIDLFFRVVYKATPTSINGLGALNDSRVSNASANTRSGPGATCDVNQYSVKRVVQLCVSFGVGLEDSASEGLPFNVIIPADWSTVEQSNLNSLASSTTESDQQFSSNDSMHNWLEISRNILAANEPDNNSSSSTHVHDSHSLSNTLSSKKDSAAADDAAMNILSSVARHTIPDAVVDFDWTENGSWHFLCLSHSDTGIKCWIDGEEKSVMSWASAAIDTNSELESCLLPGQTIAVAKKSEVGTQTNLFQNFCVSQYPSHFLSTKSVQKMTNMVELFVGHLPSDSASTGVLASNRSKEFDNVDALLSTFESVVGGMVGDISSIAIVSGCLDVNLMKQIVFNGPDSPLESSSLTILSHIDLANENISESGTQLTASEEATTSNAALKSDICTQTSDMGNGMQIHRTNSLSNGLSHFDGLSRLYNLLLSNLPKQAATLQVITDVIVSSPTMYEEFLISNTDKVILYCCCKTEMSSSPDTIQCLFDAICPSSKTCHGQELIIGSRSHLLSLLIDVSALCYEQPIMSRSIVDWLKGVCDDVTENNSNVLEVIGLTPFLLMLSLWNLNDNSKLFSLNPAANLKEDKPEKSSSLFVPVRVSSQNEKDKFAPVDTSNNRVLYSQIENAANLRIEQMELNTEKAKLQLSCGIFIKQLITGTSGHEPAMPTKPSGPSPGQTSTGFSIHHFNTLLNFVHLCLMKMEIKDAGMNRRTSSNQKSKFIPAAGNDSTSKNAVIGTMHTSTVSNIDKSGNWLLNAILIVLDGIIGAAETSLSKIILNFIQLSQGANLTQVWDLCFLLLGSPYSAVRYRAIVILTMSLSQLPDGLEPDPKSLSAFEKANGFAMMIEQLSKFPSDEAIINSLLTIMYWNFSSSNPLRAKSSSTTSPVDIIKIDDMHPKSGAIPSFDCDVEFNKFSVFAWKGTIASIQSAATSTGIAQVNSAYTPPGTPLKKQVIGTRTTPTSSIHNSSPSSLTKNLVREALALRASSPTTYISEPQSQSPTKDISRLCFPDVVVQGTETHPADNKILSSDPVGVSMSASAGRYDIDIIVVPQMFPVVIASLQTCRSLDLLQETVKKIILSIDTSVSIYSRHRASFSTATSERAMRNLDAIFNSCKDLVVVVAQAIQNKREKIMCLGAPLADQVGSGESDSTKESISEAGSVNDHYVSEDGSEHGRDSSVEKSLFGDSAFDYSESIRSFNSKGIVGQQGRPTSDQLELLCSKFVEPFYLLIETILTIDLRLKPTVARKWPEVFRLSAPDYENIQRTVIVDLVKGFDAFSFNPHQHSQEVITNYLRNFSLLLDQIIYKVEISLEFSVFVIKVVHSLSYKCPPDVRAKLKETGLLEARNTYIVQCLMDCFDSYSRDLYSRSTALCEINSPLQGYITSTDTKVLAGSHVVLYVLSIFIEAAEELEAASNIELNFVVSGDTNALIQRVQMLVDSMYVILAIVQSCVASPECKSMVNKLTKHIIGDKEEYLMNVLLKSETLVLPASLNMLNVPLRSRGLDLIAPDEHGKPLSTSPSTAAVRGSATIAPSSTAAQSTSWWSWGYSADSSTTTSATAATKSNTADSVTELNIATAAIQSNTEKSVSGADSISVIVEGQSCSSGGESSSSVPSSSMKLCDSSGVGGRASARLMTATNGAGDNDKIFRSDDIPIFLDWLCAPEQKMVFEEFKSRVNREVKPVLRKTEKLHANNTSRKTKHVRSEMDRITKERSANEKLIKEVSERLKRTTEKCQDTFNQEMQAFVDGVSQRVNQGRTALEAAIRKQMLIQCDDINTENGRYDGSLNDLVNKLRGYYRNSDGDSLGSSLTPADAFDLIWQRISVMKL